MVLSTWALVSVALACQAAESPVESTSEVLELDPVVATVGHGDTLRLSASSKNGNGSPKPLNPASEVGWMTSNPEVAVVEAGLVRGVGPGEAQITAISHAGSNGSAKVTVRPLTRDISAVTGDAQTGAPGEELGEPLVVRVTDRAGNPVVGVQVSWSVAAGKGTIEALEVATNDEGLAEAKWTLGDAPGEQEVSAAAEKAGWVSFTAKAEKESTPPPSNGMLPAFPGAEGWGALALTECRELPMVVHQVTNTNDQGPGSLRDVLENQVRGDRFDVVTFTTGGLIRLSSNIERRRAHCLYIAGQTAPGEGVSLVGMTLELRYSDDVVLRHIRHRGQNGGTALLHRGGSRVIFDHITGSWSVGRFIVRFESLDGNPLSDVTIQNSLLYEPDREHATILGLAGHPKPDPEARRMSAHRNALLGPGRRMPKCSAYEVSVVNNVIYNWQQRGAATNNTSTCDYVANYMKPGPTTLADSNRFGRRPFVFADGCEGGTVGGCEYSYYVAENRTHVNGYVAVADPWTGPNREVTCRHNPSGYWCEDDGPVPDEFRRAHPLPAAAIPVSQRPITDALVNDIMARVGHSRRLTCDGSWTPVRDAVDALRVEWFQSGTGFAERISAADMDVPVPASGSACSDEDGDGIPDEWEERFFGCATCANPAAVGANGYLIIEHYVNGSEPR